MKINGIDSEKCILCKECINECPSRLFSQDKGTGSVLFQDPLASCIRCGHCIAVCEPAAVNYETTEAALCFDNITNPEKVIPYDALLAALAARRSVRRFKDKPVDAGDLKAVLHAMQYAPSASNARGWQYIVITDKQKIARLSEETAGIFKTLRKLLTIRWLLWLFLPRDLKKLVFNPAIKAMLDQNLADYAQGKDFILFHAPCILILHAPVFMGMSGNDAGIALTYGMLAAQARGLGSCWIGFAQEAIHRKRTMRRWLCLPGSHQVFGVLALGYPDVRFHHIPPREELQVRYL